MLAVSGSLSGSSPGTRTTALNLPKLGPLGPASSVYGLAENAAEKGAARY